MKLMRADLETRRRECSSAVAAALAAIENAASGEGAGVDE